MAEALRWKSKVLLAKIETVYGTDPTPTEAILAKNVVCQPMEGEDVARDIERPFRGAQEMFAVGLRAVLEFDVELVGSGTAGTAPAWSAIARSCGLAEVVTPLTDVVYSPISSAYESTTLYFWIGGNKQAIVGCRGTAVVNVNAQEIPTIRFTLTGLWAKPALQATPAIDLAAFKTPLVATDANTPVMTVGGASLVTRSFSFNLANDVQPRLLLGREEITIVDSNEEITATVEAVALATFDPFDKANALATVAVAVTHDTRAGHIVAIAAPTCSVRRPQGYENDQGVLMWPLRLAPLPSDTGDDQFSITLT
ncbi:MAG: hypothetical protein GEU91_14185 [Rhizobiales bacterium]|nr:hypothetical protein [Hyphomicrobiales bacterium]